MNPDPRPYFAASLFIASFGCIVTDLEILSLFGDIGNGILAHGAYLSPHPIARHIRQALGARLSALDRPLIALLISVRLAASLLTALSAIGGKISLPGLSIFVGTSFVIQIRGGLGNNGSDDMLLMVMYASFLARLLSTPFSTTELLLFLAAQMSLSYLVSGLVKVNRLPWRNGISLTQLMSTETFGHPAVLAALRLSPTLTAIASTIFVFGELFGTLAPWLPSSYTLSLLSCALIFHVATAVAMGLNTFVPAFAATFPAAVYTSHLIYGHH